MPQNITVSATHSPSLVTAVLDAPVSLPRHRSYLNNRWPGFVQNRASVHSPERSQLWFICADKCNSRLSLEIRDIHHSWCLVDLTASCWVVGRKMSGIFIALLPVLALSWAPWLHLNYWAILSLCSRYPGISSITNVKVGQLHGIMEQFWQWSWWRSWPKNDIWKKGLERQVLFISIRFEKISKWDHHGILVDKKGWA